MKIFDALLKYLHPHFSAYHIFRMESKIEGIVSASNKFILVFTAGKHVIVIHRSNRTLNLEKLARKGKMK